MSKLEKIFKLVHNPTIGETRENIEKVLREIQVEFDEEDEDTLITERLDYQYPQDIDFKRLMFHFEDNKLESVSDVW